MANDENFIVKNGIVSPKIRLGSSSDASLTSTGHAFQIGATAGANIIMDSNEIMARNNGAIANLHLNLEGGDVIINNNRAVTVADYGAGNGLNADLLDGLESSAFALLSGANFTGMLSSSYINIGYNKATGGGSVGRLGYSGNRLWIAPTDLGGSFDWAKELTYNPDTDSVWVAEGGFKTTGDLELSGTINSKYYGVLFENRSSALAATLDGAIQKISVKTPSGRILEYTKYTGSYTGTIALTTNGGSTKWMPSNTITPQHWVENTIPGTTIMNDAIMNAIKYAASLYTVDYQAPTMVDLLNEVLAINTEIRMLNLSLTGWGLDNGIISAITGTWSLNYGMIDIRNTSASHSNDITFGNGLLLEGNHLAYGGIYLEKTMDVRIYCDGHGHKQFGVRTKTQNGQLKIFNTVWRQWHHLEDNTATTPEWNKLGVWDNTGTNNSSSTDYINENSVPVSGRTSIIIDIQTGDSIINNNIVYYGYIPMKIAGGMQQFVSNHPYNGFLADGEDGSNEMIAYLAGDSGFVTNNYFDNGLVVWEVSDNGTIDKGGFVFSNNIFYNNEYGTSTSALKIITNIANTDMIGKSFNGNVFRDWSSSGITNHVTWVAQNGGSFVPQIDMKWQVMGNTADSHLGEHVTGIPSFKSGAGFTMSSADRVLYIPSYIGSKHYGIVFANRAEAEAATIPTVVLSIAVKTPSGKILNYTRDSNSYSVAHALTSSDGANWSPSDTISFQHFAENSINDNTHGTSANATDMTLAVYRAVRYANEKQKVQDESLDKTGFLEDPAYQDKEMAVPIIVSGLGERIALSAPLYFVGMNGIKITETFFEPTITSSWTAGQAMLTFATNGKDKSSAVIVSDCSFEGNHKVPGFVLFEDTAHKCGVLYCYGHGMTEFGVKAKGSKNSDFLLEGNRMCQFTYDELHDDSSPYALKPDSGDTERTATIFDIQSTDHRIVSNTPFYAKRGFSIGTAIDPDPGENAAWVGGQFYGNHPFGCTEYIAWFNVSAENITNNYFDNGVVRLPAHNNGIIIFSDNWFIRSQDDNPINSYIALQLEAVVVNATGANLIITNNGFRYINGSGDLVSEEVAFTAVSGKNWVAGSDREYISAHNKYSTYKFISSTNQPKVIGDARGIELNRNGTKYTFDASGNLYVNSVNTSAVNIKHFTPTIALTEEGGSTGFNKSKLLVENDSFRLATYSDSGAYVSTDYAITKSTTGASRHEFNIGMDAALLIDSAKNVGIGTYTPTEKLHVAGNIAVTGLVDGRDIAADGNKLDSIESNATGDQTASEILTLIKTVDGAGSGLNADLLDGLQASQFLRSDANDTFTGTLTNGGTFESYHNSTLPSTKLKLGRSYEQYFTFHGESSGNFLTTVSPTTNQKNLMKFGISIDGGATISSSYLLNGSSGTIWHSGNDGTGSGLDADLLDGSHASSFARTWDAFSVYDNSRTDITALTGGTSSGDVFEGPTNAHVVIGIRGNDSSDGFHVVDTSNTGNAAYTRSILRVNGNEVRTPNKLVVTPINYVSNQNSAYLIAAPTSFTGADSSWGTYGFQHRIKSNSGGLPRVTIDNYVGERFSIDNSGDITFNTNAGSAGLTFDGATGNLGIGITSPTEKLDVVGNATISGDLTVDTISRLGSINISGSSIYKNNTDGTLNFYAGAGGAAYGASLTLYGKDVASSSVGMIYYNSFAADQQWRNYDGVSSYSNLMRLTSTGNLGIGTTSPTNKLHVIGGNIVTKNASDTRAVRLYDTGSIDSVKTGTGTNYHISFKNNAEVSETTVGAITTSGSTTSYNTSSDYRLKTAIVPIDTPVNTLMSLNPVNFEWVLDGTKSDGFIAHEIQEVLPYAVVGDKDAVDTSGIPIYQSIDHSKLIPVLTAALQEALRRIDILENKLGDSNEYTTSN